MFNEEYCNSCPFSYCGECPQNEIDRLEDCERVQLSSQRNQSDIEYVKNLVEKWKIKDYN